jgi:hypothetical protein
MKLLVSFLLFFQYSLADDLENMFNRLKDNRVNYKVMGTICEEIAKVQVSELYESEKHVIITGIEYQNSKRTLGELDVVVFRKNDQEAILVAEVKCWRKLGAAHKKATEQINRFRHHIGQNKPLLMYTNPKNKKEFRMNQFDEHPEYITISQDGGENSGFDMTLGFNLDEVKWLRQKIMSCQSSGHCPKPKN